MVGVRVGRVSHLLRIAWTLEDTQSAAPGESTALGLVFPGICWGNYF